MGCLGQRGKLPRNKTATRMINKILAIRWCQSAFADKQNMCGWFAQTPAPQNFHKASCFVESTLVVAQVPGSGAHDGLAVFLKTTMQAAKFWNHHWGLNRYFSNLCCKVQMSLTRWAQSNGTGWASVPFFTYQEHSVGTPFCANVCSECVGLCVHHSRNQCLNRRLLILLILSLSNLIYFILLTTWGQFSLQTLLWSKCGSRCRDWWRFWSCLGVLGS